MRSSKTISLESLIDNLAQSTLLACIAIKQSRSGTLLRILVLDTLVIYSPPPGKMIAFATTKSISFTNCYFINFIAGDGACGYSISTPETHILPRTPHLPATVSLPHVRSFTAGPRLRLGPSRYPAVSAEVRALIPIDGAQVVEYNSRARSLALPRVSQSHILTVSQSHSLTVSQSYIRQLID